MTMFVIQSALLLAVALIIGCAVGYVLRMLIAPAAGASSADAQSGSVPRGRAAAVARSDALANASSAAPATNPDKTSEKRDPARSKKSAAKPGSGKEKTGDAAARKSAASKTAKAKSPSAKSAASGKATRSAKPVARAAASAGNGKPAAVARPANPDDLTKISGIGPKIAEKLNGLGIYNWSQIAGWKKPERDWINAHLSFKGRVEREDWVKQAKGLAKAKPAR